MKTYITHALLLFTLSLISLSPVGACSCSYDNRPIDSAVVEPYEFIALVKITADVDHPGPRKMPEALPDYYYFGNSFSKKSVINNTILITNYLLTLTVED